jgi:TadE-like protein
MRKRIHSKTVVTSAHRAERGAEVVEFAVVLPVLLMLVFGIVWVGRAYNVYQTITRAAREGARAAAAECATCVTSDVGWRTRRVIDDALRASGLDPQLVIGTCPAVVPAGAPPCGCGGAPGPCVLQNWPLSSNPSTPQEYGVVVSFEYPYTVLLPFISPKRRPGFRPGLQDVRTDYRTINISTTVEMRQEN